MTSTRSKSRGNAAAGGTATLHMLQPSGIDSLGSVFPFPDGELGVAGGPSTTPLYRRSMPSSAGLGSTTTTTGTPDRGSCPYLNNYNTRRAAAAAAAASGPSSRGLAGGFRRGSAGITSNPGSWGAGAGPLGGSDGVGYPSPAGNLFGRRGMSVSNVGGGASDPSRGASSSSPFDRYDSSAEAASPSPYETDTTQILNGWPCTGVSTRSTTSGPRTSCASVDTVVGDRGGNSHNFENSPHLNLEQLETGTAMASSTSPPPLASDVADGGAGDRTNESSIFARWFGSDPSAPADPPRGPPVEEEPGIAVSNVNEPGSPPVPSGVQGEFSSWESEPLASLAPAQAENTPAAASAAPPPPAPPSPPVTRRTSPRRKRKREQQSPAAEENSDANVDEAKPLARRSTRRSARVKAEKDIVDVDKDDDEDPSASASGDVGTGVACCICLEVAAKTELAKVNGCEHGFCFACIEKWAERENTCPLCKERFTKIDRVNKPPSKRRKKGDAPSPRAKNTKRVKNRDQRADFTGSNALQGLLANMESGSLPHSIAQFIFSNVTGGLMTLNSSANGGGPQGSNRLPEGGISGRVVARAFPLPMGSNGPYSARSSSRGMPTRAFRVELNAAPSDRSGGGAADDPFDPIVVQPGSTTFLSASSPTSSTLRRSLQRSIPPQQDTSWEQHLAASGGSSSDLDFDDDDDDEVDELGSGGENYGSFIQRVRDLSNHRNSVLQRYHVGIGGVGGGGGNGVGGPARSYAVNSQDLTAGESAENALEIEDSDEDDDLDVIEVVDVAAN